MIRQAGAPAGAVTGRSEQSERVPPLAPGVADPLIAVEDHEWHASLLEVISSRQPGLPTADDDGVDLVRMVDALPSGGCRLRFKLRESTALDLRENSAISSRRTGWFHPSAKAEEAFSSVGPR